MLIKFILFNLYVIKKSNINNFIIYRVYYLFKLINFIKYFKLL